MLVSMNRAWGVVAAVVGVVLVVVAFIYWFTPASGLPSFFPGYNPAVAAPHFKHGLAALIVGLLCFVYAWFATGKRKARQ